MSCFEFEGVRYIAKKATDQRRCSICDLEKAKTGSHAACRASWREPVNCLHNPLIWVKDVELSAEVEKAVDDRPTREEYAKWVAFYITAWDDKEARACGCVQDGREMLRGLYEREVAALKEKI
jgi:hypothetical protein